MYQCDAYKALYENEGDAGACEAYHMHFAINVDTPTPEVIEHFNEKERYPRKVILSFHNGQSIIYNQERKPFQ